MKWLKSLMLCIIMTTSVMSQEMEYTDEIKSFQEELNAFYKSPEESPLSKKDLKRFQSHDFFDIDPDYKVLADFKVIEYPIFTMMKTSTRRLSKYKEYAIVNFELNGKPHQLTVYQSTKPPSEPKYIDYLFLPFTDLTNGQETYDVGRYIDLKIPKGDTIVIDFNKAYNPYCAYSKNYSCAIPPEENHLETQVKAGIKSSNL
ncbi:DUF1684 domain-containing protein [Mesohalobacter halotolerans]|uniref:DUF1684 domain-containing protein n=1 Tax=Mesohalobacter halotolerans TaxID=1883405 RepID=A0A4U5TSP0_9FLAO|nr:DUF1684 domain-containing protein [Mesohalobacter halotolerans]MBS3739110.1 DUF1684 domain-containing protein [Psychroflexus sp.]TKS56454.1 DUF1684 domain-containing protein [Mesohalobacter halotolerans]